MDEVTFSTVKDKFLQFGVLIFKNQSHLTSKQQKAWATRWGRLELEEIAISNKRKDGSTVGVEDNVYKVLKGNEGWHTDSTVRIAATLLHPSPPPSPHRL
jgi:alpha-ketoglutarate-dependent taurine dioxygenase